MLENIKAVIFDLDGVITDTQKIKTQISIDLLFEKYGVELTPEDYEERYAGRKTRAIFKDIFTRYNIEDDVDAFIDFRVQEIDAEVDLGIPLIPGSLEIIDFLKGQNIKVGLASGGSREWVDKITKKTDIRKKLDTIAYSDEVEEAKPNPEIYLLAAHRLRISPENCLVIEDAKNGMKAAKNAHMQCIGLVENINDTGYLADLLVHDLKDIDFTKIKQGKVSIHTNSGPSSKSLVD